MRVNGKIVVGALAALGAAAGTIAILYWETPSASVRWSFSQIHTSLARGRTDAAARFLGPVVVLGETAHPRDAFLQAYDPGQAHPMLDVGPCPEQEGHWDVGMAGRTWCFSHDPEINIWLLHRVSGASCPCPGLP